jgi:hypothetical protein
MGRRGKNIRELLKVKTKRKELNWGEFNFLENLLVFCLLSGRRVPKETGIGFTLTLDEGDSSLCLLSKIDRDRDPLVRDPQTPRPDYLAFYCSKEACVVTIIEMKAGKDTVRAFEQIVTLKRILETKFHKHLPGKFVSRVKLQGIMLTSYQQQVPLERIKREEKRGFTILPLRYNQRAELFSYVSKVNKLTDSGKLIRYRHDRGGQGRGLSPLEAILVNGALHTRVRDEILRQNFRAGVGRTGIYLNYARDNGSYCALIAGNDEAAIACKSGHRDLVASIRTELAKIGAENAFAERSSE